MCDGEIERLAPGTACCQLPKPCYSENYSPKNIEAIDIPPFARHVPSNDIGDISLVPPVTVT